MMDTITFEIGDTTVQIVGGGMGGQVLIWQNGTEHEADISLPLQQLFDAISTGLRLIKRTE